MRHFRVQKRNHFPHFYAKERKRKKERERERKREKERESEEREWRERERSYETVRYFGNITPQKCRKKLRIISRMRRIFSAQV